MSSIAEGGLEPLRRAPLAAAKKGTEIAEIRLPAENENLLAEIHRTDNVLSQRTDDGQIVLRARVDERLAGRLERSDAKSRMLAKSSRLLALLDRRMIFAPHKCIV